MAQLLRKFIPRAPRYTLGPDDNQSFRFALNSNSQNSYSTRFVNVSESGLAFITSKDSSPHVGELIKVEFPVPGSEQVAWFARVVRVEIISGGPWWKAADYEEDNLEILVAIRFINLPQGHKQAIRQGLETRYFEIQKEKRKLQAQRFMNTIAEHYKKIFVYLLCLASALAFMYYITRPSENYDAQKGAPWGQRFK